MEKSVDDYLFIRLQFPYGNKTAYLGYNGLLPALKRLEMMSLPKPTTLEFLGKSKSRMRKKTIQSYLDPQVLAVLEPNGLVGTQIEIYDQTAAFRVSISQQGLSDFFLISIHSPLLESLETAFLKKLFVDLLYLFPKTHFAHCHFVHYMSNFNRKYMDTSPVVRNNYLKFLVWLQYLSKEELWIQGGQFAFEENPLLKTERLQEGLLVQVGENPYDIFTEDGEAMLVKATFSLPPLQDSK
jgi:hypothetical protein